MRHAPALTRSLCALLLALLLGLRLLAPAGFMPSFEHGAVTIVACPDGDLAAAPMSAHHPGHSKKLHQECPFASASGLGALALDAATLGTVLVLAVALLLGRAFLFLERSRANARPPLRGPPILA
jgi:hypothetical protein